MKASAKWGRALAIAFLIMLYPAVSALFHENLGAPRVAGTLLTLAALAGAYTWFWLWGMQVADWRLVTAVVVALTGLAVLLNVITDVWTVNFFLLPLVVAGYSYRPRIAIPAIVGLSVFSLAV